MDTFDTFSPAFDNPQKIKVPKCSHQMDAKLALQG